MKRLVLAMTVCLVACESGGAGPGAMDDEPDPREQLTEAEAEVLDGLCDLFERCGSAWGRLYLDVEACLQVGAAGLLGAIQQGGQHADDDDARACVEELTGTSCDDDLSSWREGSGCAAVFGSIGGAAVPAGDPVEVGQDCSGAGRYCEGEAACVADATGGPSCYRCAALPGLGDPCASTPCPSEYVCDYGQDPAVCVDPTGRDCSSGTCPFGYFCAGADGCQVRGEDDPCASPGDDACGVPGLTCVDGLCTAPGAAAGDVCDSDSDCAETLYCAGAQCAEWLERGADCARDAQCRMYLVCDDGCTDLPGLDEPCDGQCLLPLACLEGVCVEDAPSGGFGALGNGDTCAESCGDSCTRVFGACAAGYCNTGGEPPWVCEPYVALGNECIHFGACDPAAGYCDFFAPTPVCTPWVELGGSCADGRCRDDAYCDAGEVCVERLSNGSACARPSQCDSDACYGTCDGGDHHGAPCRSAYVCTAGTCDGVCSDPQGDWLGCGG